MGLPSVARSAAPTGGVAALPWNQWQDSPGIGGSFAVESAAAFAWNRRQVYYGISGRIHLEQVAALPVESVAGFTWNRWQLCRGIRAGFHRELVAGAPWRTAPGCLGGVATGAGGAGPLTATSTVSAGEQPGGAGRVQHLFPPRPQARRRRGLHPCASGGLMVGACASDKASQRGDALPLSGPRATDQPGCFPGWSLWRAARSAAWRLPPRLPPSLPLCLVDGALPAGVLHSTVRSRPWSRPPVETIHRRLRGPRVRHLDKAKAAGTGRSPDRSEYARLSPPHRG